MVVYPEAIDSDYLVYHRLTGLRGGTADVLRMIDEGAALVPFDERGEDAEMYGIDPVDLAAGDGGAVFMTPFQPVSLTPWGKSGFGGSPGVAFRLSDLQTCCDVSVRPEDLQSFYMGVIERSSLESAYGCMAATVEDVYNRVGYLEELQGIFEVIRTAELWDAAPVLAALARGEDPVEELGPPPITQQAIRRVVESAVEFQGEFSHCDGVDPEEFFESDAPETAYEAIEAALLEQYEEAWNAWHAAKSHQVEVLAWGTVELNRACLVFDSQGIVERGC